jgi:hypothetical protein
MNQPVLIAGLFSLFSVASCSQTLKTNQRDKNTHPNVLFLFADDQRADALGFAGNPYIRTPHIDRLAQTGVNLIKFYSFL